MKIPLFDIDGTLLKGGSGNKAHRAGFDYAFKKVFGLDTAAIDEIQVEGKIDKQILTEVVKLHGVDEEIIEAKIDLAMAAIVKYYLEHANEGECVTADGVIELLTFLKQAEVPLGLLTGNIDKVAWDKLTRAGLAGFFDFGAFGNMALKRVDLITRAKEEANKNLGKNYQNGDFVIVGDTILDIACAKEGGIKVIGVAAANFSAEELLAAKADLVVNSLSQADEIIKFLNEYN